MKDRADNSQDEKCQFEMMAKHLYAGNVGTLFSHFPKVATALSATERNLINVLKLTRQKWAASFKLNLYRGSAVTALQSYVKAYVDGRCDNPIGGVAAATFVGTTIAIPIESAITRRSFGDMSRLPIKINLPLVSLYPAREIVFTTIVFCGKDLPLPLELVSVAGGAAGTTVFQNFISWETINDMYTKEIIPTISKNGLKKTIVDIAKGKENTHPAFNVPYPNAASNVQLIKNFLYVTCHPTTFTLRFSQLLLFRYGNKLAQKNPPSNEVMLRFFKAAHDPAVTEWGDNLDLKFDAQDDIKTVPDKKVVL